LELREGHGPRLAQRSDQEKEHREPADSGAQGRPSSVGAFLDDGASNALSAAKGALTLAHIGNKSMYTWELRRDAQEPRRCFTAASIDAPWVVREPESEGIT
jgi:hypothetical protein